MARDTLTILCPAKINIALSVGAAREEDGLHPICSWMVAVGFSDRLTLTQATDGHSSFDIRWAEDAPVQQDVDWPLTSDLAFRAHGLMQEHVGRALPVKMELDKWIPAGAGLGGGSSNAAGMLTGLNRLFSLGLDDDQIIRQGLRLGSDVGFLVWAMLNKGAAIVSGIGDQIDPVPASRRVIHLVLVLPPIQCATSEVYRLFDQITPKAGTDEARVKALAGLDFLSADAPFNDLTQAASRVQAGLGKMRDQVREATDLPVHLSGSGAAMFIVVATADEGMAMAQIIKTRTGLSAIYVGPTSA